MGQGILARQYKACRSSSFFNASLFSNPEKATTCEEYSIFSPRHPYLHISEKSQVCISNKLVRKFSVHLYGNLFLWTSDYLSILSREKVYSGVEGVPARRLKVPWQAAHFSAVPLYRKTTTQVLYCKGCLLLCKPTSVADPDLRVSSSDALWIKTWIQFPPGVGASIHAMALHRALADFHSQKAKSGSFKNEKD